jgi:mannosyltransferase
VSSRAPFAVAKRTVTGPGQPSVGDPRRAGAIVVAVSALAAALRFTRIGHQSFWYDETVTAQLIHRSLTGMFRGIVHTESTPPLYYCIAWVWGRVFGFGEAGLRSLSAVAGVATVPAVYGTAAKLLNRRAAVVAAALTASSPLLVWYSQEARAYALLVLLAALSLCAFVYAREEPTPRRLAVWMLASALALATHYYAALTVVPEAICLLSGRRRSRAVALSVLAVAACAGALLPLALTQTGHAPWIALLPLGRRVLQVPRQFALGPGAPAPALLLGGMIAMVGLALAALLGRREAGERRGASVAGGLLGAGVAMNVLLVLVGIDNLITRNVIVLWLPSALVVAAGLAAVPRRWLAAVGCLAGCAVSTGAALGVAFDSGLQRPDWRAVARALGPPLAPGAPAGRAILVQRNLVELWLYAPGVRFMGPEGARVDQLEVVASTPPHDRACWWGGACMLVPSALPRSLAVAGLRVSGPVVRVAQFRLLALRARGPVWLTPGMLARALPGRTLSGDLLFVQAPICRPGPGRAAPSAGSRACA